MELIRRAAEPPPGCVPSESLRPLLIPADMDGFTLLQVLCGILPHQPEESWRSLCEAGYFRYQDGTPLEAHRVLRQHERIVQHIPNQVEPAVNADIRILHEDAALVIVNKPAPLPMHPGGPFNKNTLQYFLNLAYAPLRPKPVHPLDANTSGVVVWTKTRHFAKLLQPQFTGGQVGQHYLVRTRHQPAEEHFSYTTPISPEPGLISARRVDENGLGARTDFRLLQRFPDGTALLAASPNTDRSDQIRIHLHSIGLPICGEPASKENGEIDSTMTLSPQAPPLCLHSWKISFQHPLTKNSVEFEAPPPAWASPEGG